MAKGNETTTKFKVDISELKKAMQDARKQVAYANSEFKATASSMDDWSKSSEGLGAKLKQLNSNLKSQEAVLAEYEKTLEEIKKEYGENSKEALEYATKLNNQQAVVSKIKKEMSDYEDALEEVSKAEKIASKTGQDVADVLADVGNEADDAGEGFTVLKGAVADFVGSGLSALVGGVKDAIGSFMSLADETREYREQMNKLDSASAEAGYGVDYAKKKYKELYGVLADETATTTTISNFMALNAEQEILDSLLNSSVGIWAKYGDSIPLDGLAEAINHTSKVGTVQGTLADALEWSGISVESFNESLAQCTSEQGRQQLIANVLERTYGDLSASYQEGNASVIEANKAQSDYADTMAKMGETIEPIMTTLKIGVTELLNEFLKLVGDVDMEAFNAKIQEGFGVLKDEVLPAVKEGLGWIIDNKDTLIAGLASIASGFVAFKVAGLITSVITAMKAWAVATQGMTIAQKALNLVMSLNPIGIVVALIAGLVTAFITLWNTSDEFRQFWIDLWEKIKGAVKVAIEGIGKFFTETLPKFFNSLLTWIKSNWDTLLLLLINPFAGLFKYFYENNTKFKEFVDNAILYIKELPVKVWTWLLNTIAKINQWRIDLGQKAREAGQELLNKLIEKMKEIPDKVKSVGADIVAGLWNGISDKFGWLTDKIKGFASNVTDKLKDFFGIHSPSKVMADEVGKWLPEGIAVGISKNAKSVLGAMRDLTMDTVGSARAGLSTATTLGGGSVGGVVNNFTQVINSPKQLSRLEIYRQSKNLLGYAGGGI